MTRHTKKQESEMIQFSAKLLKWIKEETEKKKGHISSKEIEFVAKKAFPKEKLRHKWLVEFYQTFKGELLPLFFFLTNSC